ncbi:hypothetical protein Leryth_016226, partial [Lithospermum erythrorhizon]
RAGSKGGNFICFVLLGVYFVGLGVILVQFRGKSNLLLLVFDFICCFRF